MLHIGNNKFMEESFVANYQKKMRTFTLHLWYW